MDTYHWVYIGRGMMDGCASKNISMVSRYERSLMPVLFLKKSPLVKDKDSEEDGSPQMRRL